MAAAETVAAEDVLHDSGAISMISSDSQVRLLPTSPKMRWTDCGFFFPQAMGRIGEVVSRTWRTAAKMREFRGPLPGEKEGSDNLRVKVCLSSTLSQGTSASLTLE